MLKLLEHRFIKFFKLITIENVVNGITNNGIIAINKNTVSVKNTIEVYAINGVKVYSETMATTSGFYNKTLDLSSLQSGMYMVTFTAGKNSVTKKLILN